MNMDQLDAESAELLPGREALGKLKFSFVKTTHVTKNIAHVDAHNESLAANQFSPFAVAQSEATQAINIRQ
ncbi:MULTISPECIES: hypothetical protein [Streptomycetaceae]|uniref:Uncharacterized protein n=1 Tax=Actinacidiphila glaucinigra TaxID=235986 RepID=A0A239P083_9ACTN|nr:MULTISPECIES: hypothetical protein [Streptomycetaceae]MDX2852204.1 hypothetical protein [Streptomyces sp. PA03-3a]WSD60184.1 hypothetical protein OIE69_15245 [Actinacidiphila glaucinigra]SNT60557.1 hypothetical protein SAMN05216252_1687 [Actinacidiphila glaucinigra]